MKKLNRIAVVLMIFALVSMCLVSCKQSKQDANNEIKIGIIQYISHPSLDNCYNGIKQALEKSDFSDRISIDYQIGSDNSADSDCASYAKNMVAQKYDMIIAIATPAATSAYAATEGTNIPVIFCAVSDPVTPQLVQSLDVPGGLCTGTSDVLDFSAQVNLITSMQADVKNVGVIYTTSEANSITQLAMFKKVCEQKGISVDAIGVQNASDIPSASATLSSRVDCINNFTDNNVVTNLSVVLEAANNANIPVYGSEEEQVKNGCLASMSIDYIALGNVTGNMAVSVLGGSDPAKMPVQSISEATPVINKDVLEKLSLTIPENYNNAQLVTTNNK